MTTPTSSATASKTATAASSGFPVVAGPGFSDTDALSEKDLYKCVHCGFCLNVCPTYLATGLESESPRGRIALMKAVNEGRLGMTPSVISHWEMCIQCRACEPACPSNVPYGRLIEATRVQINRVVKRPWHVRLGRRIGFRILLQRPSLLRLYGRATRLYQRTGLRRMAHATGFLRLIPGDAVSADKYLPDLKTPFFSARNQTVIPLPSERKAKVALLSGCAMSIMHGPTMEAAMRVLRRNGIEVVVPSGQGCCGALNVHAGERDSAQNMARRNIDTFLDSGFEAVITASGGCGAAMKDYSELLENDPEYAEKASVFSAMTRDIHEYLVEKGFAPPSGALDMRVTYQDACHLAHPQGIASAPRQILAAIPGIELVELPESSVCCGAGGTYSIFQKDMSQTLQNRKIDNIERTGATVVASGNPGCVLQIQNGLESRGASIGVKYVVDLLDEAYSKAD